MEKKSSQNVPSNTNVLNKKVSTVTGFALIGVSVAIFFAVVMVAQAGF